MLSVGDRVKNTFSGLTATVVEAHYPFNPHTRTQSFCVKFDDDAKAARHYVRNGPYGSFVFTSTLPWVILEPDPVPMDDTRDYLNTLISLRAS